MKTTKSIPFIKLIPNFITIVGLVVGASSIRFALEGRWEFAIYCILIAGIMDGVDGRVARILNATSPFGAELDTLCDFANFGVCPAIITYLWSFQQYEFKLFSWSVLLLFVVCMCLRLARFNTSLLPGTKVDKRSKYFSTGVPAPFGALLLLFPIISDFEISTSIGVNIKSHTFIIDLYICFVSLLLVSRLPTFLFKNISIKPEYLLLIIIATVILIINVIIYPWYVLPLLTILYLLSIPLCMNLAKKIN